MPSFLCLSFWVLLAALGFGGPLQAARPPGATDRSIVAFDLRINTATPGSARIGLGDTLTIAREDGVTVGLVPSVDGDGLALDAFQIATDPVTGAESRRWLGRVALRPHVWADVSVSPIPIALQWTDSLPRPAASSPQTSGPCTRCCVTCEGLTLCGCRIILDCGWCCCSDTCNCDIITSSRPAPTTARTRKRP
jgi:hypothetical protein